VIRGAVYRVDLGDAKRGHEQRGRRLGVVLSPSSMAWSVATIVPTSTSAQSAVFRPELEINGQLTVGRHQPHRSAEDVSGERWVEKLLGRRDADAARADSARWHIPTTSPTACCMVPPAAPRGGIHAQGASQEGTLAIVARVQAVSAGETQPCGQAPAWDAGMNDVDQRRVTAGLGDDPSFRSTSRDVLTTARAASGM
jgi:hypothetical protein